MVDRIFSCPKGLAEGRPYFSKYGPIPSDPQLDGLLIPQLDRPTNNHPPLKVLYNPCHWLIVTMSQLWLTESGLRTTTNQPLNALSCILIIPLHLILKRKKFSPIEDCQTKQEIRVSVGGPRVYPPSSTTSCL